MKINNICARLLTLLSLAAPFNVALSATEITTFGDSITAGYPYTVNGDGSTSRGLYQPPLKTLLNNNENWDVVVRNYGVSGELATQSRTRSRFNAMISRHKPDYVLLMEGTNDLPHGFSPNYIASKLSSMVNEALSNGSDVVIGTLLPDYRPNGKNITGLNSRIEDIAEDYDIPLADLYNATNWRPYMQSDKLHPNSSGGRKMAEVFYNALDARRISKIPPKKPSIVPVYLLLL